MATTFLPWGSSGIFSPSGKTKSPRELVTENHTPHRAPADVRVWMLRQSASESLWADPTFNVFADLSAQALFRALASEIKPDGSLVFRGPPHTLLNPPSDGAHQSLRRSGYNELRNAAAWVYENSTEAEQRHGLFCAEFGATHPPTADPADAFSKVIAGVLQGARLAYQLSLSDLTREAIKAQADLRKAVSDDTSKIAENTRQVATAVAASLATCVGLIAAKIGTTTPPLAIQVIAVVAAVYVGAVIASGCIYMHIQRDMRRKWRSRLYRFIPPDDYKEMVLDPAGKAEKMYMVFAVAGGIIAFLAVLLVFLIA